MAITDIVITAAPQGKSHGLRDPVVTDVVIADGVTSALSSPMLYNNVFAIIPVSPSLMVSSAAWPRSLHGFTLGLFVPDGHH